MNYLSPLLRKLLGGVIKHYIREREREKPGFLAEELLLREKEKRKKNVRNKHHGCGRSGHEPHICTFSRQKIFEFDRSFPSSWYCSCKRLLPARRYHLSGNENGALYFWIIITSQTKLAPHVSLSLELRVTAELGWLCVWWLIATKFVLVAHRGPMLTDDNYKAVHWIILNLIKAVPLKKQYENYGRRSVLILQRSTLATLVFDKQRMKEKNSNFLIIYQIIQFFNYFI